ncbi:tRNA(m(1)G37)methyltransferase [Paramarasmius palmivorus]|uniref:tRNA (guanine(37)-N1)-methyltransferase n=1 Tax=Paramarasmius palmivorus TaxID=297713 RepID=A0AAW0E278_9AGAR
MHIDTSPPKYHGPLSPLDKSAFRKTIPVLAMRVPASRTATLLKTGLSKNYLVGIPKVKPAVRDPSAPEDGDRLLLLNASKEADIAPETLEFLKSEGNGFVNHDLVLDYDHWTASEILRAILPENLWDGAPTGFAATGHIAHMNLNEEYLPFKHVIGQVFLDKNKSIKTVVNKLDNIDTQFRFFEMEVLAGEPNFIVEHHESDCRFTFDFSQVYWNSRLHTEHKRIVTLLKPGEVLADVFAGVGPFALPAAKKGCAVLANDLNPNSVKYLSRNIEDNQVADIVRASCEDGRDFIRRSFQRVADAPFPPYQGPRLSKNRERKLQKEARKKAPETDSPAEADLTPSVPPRKTIDHFVMNLPDTAILFLDAFRGVLSNPALRVLYDKMPLIHCHCFTRELEPENAEIDIRQRVEEKLGSAISEDMKVVFVRSVAPGKDMYCVSFRLPVEVATLDA